MIVDVDKEDNTIRTDGCDCCSHTFSNKEEWKPNIIEHLQQNISVAKECADLIGYDFKELIKDSSVLSYTKEEIEEWKAKAKKWDGMKKEISKFYCNVDGEYDEENPERQGDLCSIGEVAASWSGWL